MSKTGLELNDHTVGEAAVIEDGTVYPVAVVKIRVTLKYGPYMVTPINGEDSGERYVIKVVNLTKQDFSSLTAAQRIALLNLVESKI